MCVLCKKSSLIRVRKLYLVILRNKQNLYVHSESEMSSYVQLNQVIGLFTVSAVCIWGENRVL